MWRVAEAQRPRQASTRAIGGSLPTAGHWSAFGTHWKLRPRKDAHFIAATVQAQQRKRATAKVLENFFQVASFNLYSHSIQHFTRRDASGRGECGLAAPVQSGCWSDVAGRVGWRMRVKTFLFFEDKRTRRCTRSCSLLLRRIAV